MKVLHNKSYFIQDQLIKHIGLSGGATAPWVALLPRGFTIPGLIVSSGYFLCGVYVHVNFWIL